MTTRGEDGGDGAGSEASPVEEPSEEILSLPPVVVAKSTQRPRAATTAIESFDDGGPLKDIDDVARQPADEIVTELIQRAESASKKFSKQHEQLHTVWVVMTVVNVLSGFIVAIVPDATARVVAGAAAGILQVGVQLGVARRANRCRDAARKIDRVLWEWKVGDKSTRELASELDRAEDEVYERLPEPRAHEPARLPPGPRLKKKPKA